MSHESDSQILNYSNESDSLIERQKYFDDVETNQGVKNNDNLNQDQQNNVQQNIMLLIFTLLIAFLISMSLSHYGQTSNVLSNNIIHGQLDKRQYKAIILSNDLRVVLIQDDSIQLSAVSMNVNVGSFNDPDDIPGLAHYLEHMLFMGSQKYKSETEFNDYISKNGGQFNAYTDLENTNFHFSIQSNALEKALDIFSHFFIDPLFSSNSVDSEVSSVNSEYENDVSDPNWKQGFLIKMMSNKQNPFQRFNIGNFETLKTNPVKQNIDICQRLKKFWMDNYSSNLMSLVIIGNQSLSELEKMSKIYFTPIVNQQFQRQLDKKYPEVYLQSQLNKLVKFSTESEQKSMYLTYPLDETVSLWKQKPIDYITYHLDHNGPNGLQNILKNKGFIIGLEVGVYYQTSQFTIFQIEFLLTEKGYLNSQEIIQDFYNYIALLKDEGVIKKIYDDLIRISLFNFQYKEKKKDIMEDAKNIANNLEQYPIDQILTVDFLFLQFDQKLIQSFLNKMSIQNSLIMISNKEYKFNQNYTTSFDSDYNSTVFKLQLSNYSALYKFAFDIQTIQQNILSLDFVGQFIQNIQFNINLAILNLNFNYLKLILTIR